MSLELLKCYAPIIVAIIMVTLLTWLRSGNKGGKLGQAVRNSDWNAWRMAMDDKERELEELRRVEPQRYYEEIDAVQSKR